MTISNNPEYPKNSHDDADNKLTLSDDSFKKAEDFLANLDPDWQALVAKIGPCQLQTHADREPFESLVRAVIFQQLHGKAAKAILQRFLAALEDNSNRVIDPHRVIALEVERMRRCGLSARKTQTIKIIAENALAGVVPSREKAQTMTNGELISQLTHLKGVGRWTVEMFLMHALARQDVLPCGDLGVRQGYQRLKNAAQAPTPSQIKKIGKAWQPYRTIAAWYLWRVPVKN